MPAILSKLPQDLEVRWNNLEDSYRLRLGRLAREEAVRAARWARALIDFTAMTSFFVQRITSYVADTSRQNAQANAAWMNL